MASTRQRIETELKKAEANVGKYVSRNGVDYATFGYNLDAAISDKRDFAVSWRRHVLELNGELTDRTITVTPARFHGDEEIADRVYRVFMVDGRDALVIYSKGGSNCTDRVTEIVSGKAEEALIASGWRVKG